MGTESNAEYGADQIQILEGLEAVRKRPGMYIGSTSSRGLHHLVYEIVDNAVDEALAGYCDTIQVTINKDNSVTVIDNGRGIPVGINHKAGIPAVEVVFTILHAGGKFGGGGYKVSGGLHGVGASVVNALSTHLEVTIYHEGKIYRQRYERGKVVYKLKVIGECDPKKTGTTVTFLPDSEIFEETVFDFNVLKQRLREMAFLTKNNRQFYSFPEYLLSAWCSWLLFSYTPRSLHQNRCSYHRLFPDLSALFRIPLRNGRCTAAAHCSVPFSIPQRIPSGH